MYAGGGTDRGPDSDFFTRSKHRTVDGEDSLAGRVKSGEMARAFGVTKEIGIYIRRARGECKHNYQEIKLFHLLLQLSLNRPFSRILCHLYPNYPNVA